MNDFEKVELLDALFKHATEGIIISNSSGEIYLINPSCSKMFGFEISDLIGQNIDILVPDNIHHRHASHRADFMANPHSRPMGLGLDLFGKRKNGTLFPIEISLSSLIKKGEKYVIAFLIDISVRKQIEASVHEKQKELEKVAAALIRTNEELEKKVSDRTKVLQEAIRELERSRNELSQALEKEKDLNDLKSRFISMASHEFRTPLTTILSSASLIPEYSKPEHEDKRTKHIHRIKSSVNNLNDILSDFLSISKLEEGKIHADFYKFNLKDLLEEINSDMQLNAKANQKIVLAYSGSEIVNLDPKLIKNILINLISNAIKFSSENKNIYVSCIINESQSVIEVKDEGMGISEDDQKHLFERFYRGKNAFNIQGTGLGLHIVGNYIDLMKGHLYLRSKLNEGTSIQITFPNQTH